MPARVLKLSIPNLNLIDGVFSPKSNGELRFHRVNAPHVQRAQRVGSDDQRARCMIPGTSGAPSQGWLRRDEQSDRLNLSLDNEEGATLQQLQGHSITYRIAMGPQAGRKVLTACAARFKQFEAWEEDDYGTGQLGKIGGFSLHGGGLPPLDFMAELAALVPKPRTNLTGPPTDDFMEYWHGAAFRRTVVTEKA